MLFNIHLIIYCIIKLMMQVNILEYSYKFIISNIVIDKTSKIKLTGDSYVTKLTNSNSSNSNIDFNGYKLYVNGETIN